MTAINLIFPHQLFSEHPIYENGYPIYMVEEMLFFKQFNFHKIKLAYHRATMQYQAADLRSRGMEVVYIEAVDPRSDIRILLERLAKAGVDHVHYIDPTDDWLSRRIKGAVTKYAMALTEYESPLFMNSRADNRDFFKAGKSRFFQTSFYKSQRLKYGLLIDDKGEPSGGKWSFDEDNRKKYPAKKSPPVMPSVDGGEFWQEAVGYVRKHFGENSGDLPGEALYPIHREAALVWLEQFFKERFAEFGDYEDAIVQGSHFLNHSVLTPMMNIGLTSPGEVVTRALEYARVHQIPLNSTEGFIRQITGWREFIRGMYEAKGQASRTMNYWKFKRRIPASFYTGDTGIVPVDETIRKVLATGYCHHIERLMILGNFMLLCEFDPREVYRWFMELFVDAYDWVMVPNVYGMSQFADGGLFATKPYISGSNYLLKMSDYKRGEWQEVWDALFWRFMAVHRDFFTQNPRLGMLVKNWDKMAPDRKEFLLKTAESYLGGLDQGVWRRPRFLFKIGY